VVSRASAPIEFGNEPGELRAKADPGEFTHLELPGNDPGPESPLAHSKCSLNTAKRGSILLFRGVLEGPR